MSSVWLDGVVGGVHEGREYTVYFVHTRDGIAVAYPRIHNRNPEVKVGAYVRVTVSPAPKKNLSMEVEELVIARKPADHNVAVVDASAQITCDAKFIGRDGEGWLIFDNGYLGRLAMKCRGEESEGGLKSGCLYRANCRRAIGMDRAPSHAYWMVTHFSTIEPTADRWYEGIFTKCSDRLIIIMPINLPVNVILPARYCTASNRDNLLGKWVQFQLKDVHSNEKMYAAKGNYTLIDPLMETRKRNGVVELLTRCFYSGKEEDNRPLLESPVGLIRDNDGIINKHDSYCEYDVWVLHHHNCKHSARWKISFHERTPRKIDGREDSDRIRHEFESHRHFDSMSADNPNDWMVQSVSADRETQEKSRREEKGDGVRTADREMHLGHADNAGRTEMKDRRVIDFMSRFMHDRKVRSIFLEKEPSARRIMQILENDKLHN